MERFKKKALTTGLVGVLTFFGWQTAQDVYRSRLDDCYDIATKARRNECILDAETLNETTNIIALGGLAATAVLAIRTYNEADEQITSPQ